MALNECQDRFFIPCHVYVKLMPELNFSKIGYYDPPV